LAVLFVLMRERGKMQQPDQSALMLQQQLNSLQERLDTFGQSVTQNLQQSTASMNTRLDKAAGVIGDLREKVGQIHEVGKAAQEAERVAAREQVLRDVKKHVDAIATKYILPDEGTYDFALMYVPAENVYYETIIKEDVGEDRQLFSYALAKRVIPVSPNSFYAYIQTILLGLRGMKVEERAQEILGELSRLRGDFQKIQVNFRVLGRHLNNAAGSYSETDKTMTKLDAKLSQIEQPGQQTE